MVTITAVQESFGLDLSEHVSEVLRDLIFELSKVEANFITDIKVFEGINDGKVVLLRCIIPADKTVAAAVEVNEGGRGSGHSPKVGCVVIITDKSLSCDVNVDEFEVAVRAAADKHGDKDCHDEQTTREERL